VGQQINTKQKGLWSNPNEFSATPLGALRKADNCVVDADDILEQRRGNERLAEFPISGDRGYKFASFQSQIMALWTSGKIGYRNGATFTALSGTYSDPDASLARRRFVKAASSLFFTTSGGVYKLSTYNGTPGLTGVPKALDIQPSTTSGSFFDTDNQLAYRVVWGIRDTTTNRVIRGAPSGRAIVVNATGSAKDVSITLTIPSGITTSYFFQVYRSKMSGGSAVVPDDELQLVYENNPTGGEIAAGVITFTDNTPESLLGETIYIAPSQQGQLQANDRPPLADDIEEFQSCMFYANCASKHRKIVTLLATTGSDGIQYGDIITIAGTPYTFKGTEASASGTVALYGSVTVTGTVTNGSSNITAIADTSNLRVGKLITGTGVPALTYIGSIVANTSVGMVDATGAAVLASGASGAPSSVVYSDGTPAQNIADTATSLIRVINRYATNTLVNAYYLSGPNDLPGAILLEERAIGGSSFAIIASGSSTAYNPVLPTSGTTVSSSNDDFQHQLFFSKTDEHEAVPLLNYRFVGSANNPIRRIKKLRNTLFIFKEKEGIFKCTGTGPEDFAVEEFDSSAKLLAPDSVAVVNNQIWCLCDQGVSIVTETGVSTASRPIEDMIQEQFGAALNPLRYYSHGIAYESDRKYILCTVSSAADTYPTQAFVFNVFTKSWTRWPLNINAGFVHEDDDKLYMAGSDNSWMTQERKNRDYTDYVDQSVAYTIVSASGTTVYLTDTNEIEAGDVLYQSASVQSMITAVEPGFVTVQDELTWSAGAATVFKGIQVEAEWLPATGGNPGTLKQFPAVSLLFRNARFNTAQVGFATDGSGYFEDVDINGNRTGLWGLFPWGEEAWGATPHSVPIYTEIPLEKQVGSWLIIRFKIRQGYSTWKLLGYSLPSDDTGNWAVAP
jgi:hypothetical protein